MRVEKISDNVMLIHDASHDDLRTLEHEAKTLFYRRLRAMDRPWPDEASVAQWWPRAAYLNVYA